MRAGTGARPVRPYPGLRDLRRHRHDPHGRRPRPAARLNRRIRDDLIALGIVSDGPAVRIADGIPASPGDLIICTLNDHTTEAGEPGRTLANGDLLRIEAVTRKGLLVRRALDADPRTGLRRWTDRRFGLENREDAELGYAVTDHAAQGRTVHTALAVITGTEDRQHAYVALTRGTDANHAYVFTASPERADPVPGPRPAPDLAWYDKIHAERVGIPAAADVGDIARLPWPRPFRVVDCHRAGCPLQRAEYPPSAVAGGIRRVCHVLYLAGIVQLRNDTKPPLLPAPPR